MNVMTGAVADGQQERLDWIDWLKGLAILFVVYGHMPFADGESNPGKMLAYSFHMPLFFLLSGYTAALSFSHRPQVIPFCRRRVLSLMVPCVVWFLFGRYFQFAGHGGWSSDVAGMLKCMLAGYGQWWFLPCMFLMQVLLAVVMAFKAVCRFKGAIIIGVMLALLFCLGCNAVLAPFFLREYGVPVGYLVRMQHMVWPFALGCALYWYKPLMGLILRSEWVATAAIAAYLVSCNYGWGGMALSGSAAGVLLVRLFAGSAPKWTNLQGVGGFVLRQLKLFGKCSMAIYVTAWIFQSEIPLMAGDGVPQILVFAFNMALSVLIAYLCVCVKQLVNTSRVASLLLFGESLKR